MVAVDKCHVWPRNYANSSFSSLVHSFLPKDTLLRIYYLQVQSFGFMHILIHISKKEGKDQESTQSSTTPDPGQQWESNNTTIRYHKREPRGKPPLSRRPQGNNKQTCMKAQQNKTETTQMIHKRSTILERLVNIFYRSA